MIERGTGPQERRYLLSKQAVTTETPAALEGAAAPLAITSGHSADVRTLQPFSLFESHAQPINRPRLEAGVGL